MTEKQTTYDLYLGLRHFLAMPTPLVRYLCEVETLSQVVLTATPYIAWQRTDYPGYTWYYSKFPQLTITEPRVDDDVRRYDKDSWNKTFSHLVKADTDTIVSIPTDREIFVRFEELTTKLKLPYACMMNLVSDLYDANKFVQTELPRVKDPNSDRMVLKLDSLTTELMRLGERLQVVTWREPAKSLEHDGCDRWYTYNTRAEGVTFFKYQSVKGSKSILLCNTGDGMLIVAN